MKSVIALLFWTQLAIGAVPAASTFSGTYECAALTRDLPDRIPYYRLVVNVAVKGTSATIKFKEPNRGDISFGGGPLTVTASDDGWEWRSGDYQQYIAIQKTDVGRFLTITHQDGQFRYSAVACMKKK